MFFIVIATLAFADVITITPKKLNIADIITAFGAESDLVATQEAIELGASVHPLTKITPKVNATAMNSRGLAVI